MVQRQHVHDIAVDRDRAPDQPEDRSPFVLAIAADSHLELEWLWLFTRVTQEEERRYCLERALYIDPHSEMARHELAKLSVLSRAPMARIHAARIGTRLIAAVLAALAVTLGVIAVVGAIA
jgi:hypothetical protein